MSPGEAAFHWRVTVVSEGARHRRTLYLATPTADAREAYDLAIAVLKSWPVGSRIVEIVPTRRVSGDDDGGSDDDNDDDNDDEDDSGGGSSGDTRRRCG